MARFTVLPVFSVTLMIAVMMELQAQNDFNYQPASQSLRPLQQPNQEQPRNPVPPVQYAPQGQQQPQNPVAPPGQYVPQTPSIPAPPSQYLPPQGASQTSPPGQSPPRPPEFSPPTSSGTGTLDQASRNLIQTFDDFLFENLQEVYYKMSYAYKDVIKKTLDKCGCDSGAPLEPAATPPTPPK